MQIEPQADAFAATYAKGEPQVVWTTLVADLEAEIEALVAHPDLLENNPATLDICRQWDDFCHRLFHAYQDLALDEVNRSG